MDDIDKRQVFRFLNGIEEGSSSLDDCYQLILNFDPLLAHFLLRYLREKYPPTENTGAAERLLSLLSSFPKVAKLANPPQNEPFCEWFDDTYSMREFFSKPEVFVNTIIDKLEG